MIIKLITRLSKLHGYEATQFAMRIIYQSTQLCCQFVQT